MSAYIRSPYRSTRRPQTQLGRNQNSVAFMPSVKLGPVAHTILIALLMTVLGLIYLTQASQATSLDYARQEADQTIADLNTQKTDLQVANANLTSIQAVQNSAVAQKMTQPTDVKYAAAN